MSHFGPGRQAQAPYAGTDMHNQQYNQNSDTELINLAHEAHIVRSSSRPFDWFICSVLGYLCFPSTGICAMYYAIRANHAVDWERDPESVRDHTKKAKCLTLTSITLGVVFIATCTIALVVVFINARSEVYHIGNQFDQAASQFGQAASQYGQAASQYGQTTSAPFKWN